MKEPVTNKQIRTALEGRFKGFCVYDFVSAILLLESKADRAKELYDKLYLDYVNCLRDGEKP